MKVRDFFHGSEGETEEVRIFNFFFLRPGFVLYRRKHQCLFENIPFAFSPFTLDHDSPNSPELPKDVLNVYEGKSCEFILPQSKTRVSMSI